MKAASQSIVAAIVDVCHRLSAAGYVAATDGNVSARLRNGSVLATRTGINKGMLRRRDILEVRPDGSAVRNGKRPSSELGMHLFIYRERPDIGAVVHAHPPYATAFATARLPLDDGLFPEVILGFGTIPLAAYATPSTAEVAESIAPFVRGSDAILLANHGVVTFGPSVMEAFFKMQKVEHTARIVFLTRMLGGGKPLTPKELQRLREAGDRIAGTTSAKPGTERQASG
jgi:L-fuculose-phosphate aldolase